MEARTVEDMAVIETEDRLEDEEALEALREILIDRYRQHLTDLQSEIDDVQELLTLLEEQVNDKDALISTITPVMSEAISTSIRGSRDEMIEALYPITGRLVSRAVTEAMRDLARSIDHQMRDTFSVASMKRRAQARLSGVSDSEMIIRTSLPFRTEDIFLIHRESGLLITHLSSKQNLASDSDLISGMLTAIRDFVQDSFGKSSDGQLDSIQYGSMQILIEAGRYAYLAAVVHGYEPAGYRSQLRDCMHKIGNEYFRALRDYDGDASYLDGTQEILRPLLVNITPDVQDASTKQSASPLFYNLTRFLLWSGLMFIILLSIWRIWMLSMN